MKSLQRIAPIVVALAALAAGPSLASKDVVFAVASTFTTTDPYDANDTLSQAMAKSFYEGLYGFDKDMKMIPVLAESYDVSKDGSLSNGRLFGEEPGGKSDGVPDGIKVDLNGNLFVTGPKGIWIWSPDGVHLGTIALPEQPANLTWGGKNLRTLYITATTSVYRLETKTTGFSQR